VGEEEAGREKVEGKRRGGKEKDGEGE